MQMTDLVKLIHQHVFGGGHLITDPKSSLLRLKEEVRARERQPAIPILPNHERFEPIGNGLCRLHLSGIEKTGIDLETVNTLFVMTANQVTGTAQQFQSRLDEARQLMMEQVLLFEPANLDAFMAGYDFEICPPVRHSRQFRDAYAPAYRIVQAEHQVYFDAFCRIDQLLLARPTVRVAIDGYCGSGKSTLANLLRQVYGGEVIHMDHFFLPPALRTQERLREIGGNIDYERFEREVGNNLIGGRDFQYQMFDCATMAPGPEIAIKRNRITIIEGSYSMHAKLNHVYDLKIFLKIDPDEQMRRIGQRSPQLLERFVREWIPMENRYFEGMRVAEQSDLVIQSSTT